MASRSFSVKSEHDELHDFTVDGIGQLDQQPWSESFRCLPDAPAAALDDLAASVGVDNRGRMVWNQGSLLRFFRAVLHPDDEERFDALVNDKNRVLPLEALGDIMFWLGEVYTERPTEPPSSSAGGRAADAATSPGSADSPV